MHVGTRVVSPTGKKGCAVGRKDKNVTGTSQEKKIIYKYIANNYLLKNVL